MAGLDNVGQHPLSLKVMRVSRPSLAAHWQPFFSSSPSLSAHSTASPLSLQGAEPLPGHPKTLRDLTQASNLLTLPAAFGAIQLGETFSCVLSVNNEAGVPVDSVQVKVEMQTVSNKVTLEELAAGASEDNAEDAIGTLPAGDSLELCVATEIKELGQHVLACTVTYRTPPGMRPATSGGGSTDDPFLQTFRKFYKFMVTNPLSVKTKVHVPKSPTSLLSRTEREKVFLEVHIQNLTQGPLWFEKIRLEAVEGWTAIDANVMRPSASSSNETTDEKSIFSDSIALMGPQDMRQYVYIMTPKQIPRSTSVRVPPAPGTVIPLGRLDISWRSSMGEPGRLLTSVLSRRVPLPPPPSSGVAPPSALPPYLQKSIMPNSPRPRSPSLHQHAQQQHRTSTPPPQRPSSPMKRSTTPGLPVRPHSPSANAPPIPTLPGQIPPRADVEIDLVLLEGPDEAAVRVEEPFSLRFSLAISATQPSNTPTLLGEMVPRRSRVITLAVQHTLPAPPPAPEQTLTTAAGGPSGTRTLKKRTSTILSFDTAAGSGMHSPSSHAGSIDVLTPRRVLSPPPGVTNPNAAIPGTATGENIIVSPTSTLPRGAATVTVGGLDERLRRVALSEALGLRDGTGGSSEAFGDADEVGATAEVRLPSPYSTAVPRLDEQITAGRGSIGRVQFTGSSAVFLPPITLVTPADAQASSPLSSGGRVERREGSVEFTLSYLPRARGFTRVGGLRVLLVKDEEKETHGLTDEAHTAEEMTLHTQGEVQAPEAQILKEWETVAEMWVR